MSDQTLDEGRMTLVEHLTELRKRVSVPVALGENAHTIQRFRDLIDAGCCDIVQPNVVRVGGITPFLAIAELARDRGVRLAPHLLPELSGQLALTLPEPSRRVMPI